MMVQLLMAERVLSISDACPKEERLFIPLPLLRTANISFNNTRLILNSRWPTMKQNTTTLTELFCKSSWQKALSHSNKPNQF